MKKQDFEEIKEQLAREKLQHYITKRKLNMVERENKNLKERILAERTNEI